MKSKQSANIVLKGLTMQDREQMENPQSKNNQIGGNETTFLSVANIIFSPEIK